MDFPILLPALVTCFLVVSVGRSAGKRLPITGVDNTIIHRNTPGCQLGKEVYDVGEVWNPELEPNGVMHCIVCKCLAVVKKGVLQQQGKVTCRNVKHQCPRTDCDRPLVAPGACCKLCPDQGPLTLGSLWGRYIRVGINDKSPTLLEDEPEPLHGKSQAEFLAVLTSSTSPGVARGRFILHGGIMYFTIQYSRLPKLFSLQFQDENGVTLYDHKIKDINRSINQACGTWQHIPKTHARALQQGKMLVTLVTSKNAHEVLRGRITHHKAIEKETFSAILTPDSPAGGGAVAAMSLASNYKSLQFLLVLADLDPPAGSPQNYTVKFRRGSKELKRIELQQSQKDSELTGVWANVGSSVSRALGRGRLSIAIKSHQGTSVTLKGTVTPKITCNGYQAVLSGWAARVPVAEGSAGAAVFQILPNGAVRYQVRLVGMQSRVTSLKLQTAPNRKGRVRKMCKLTKSFRRDRHSRHVYDGWANGTCTKLTARQVQYFVRGDMFLRVNTRGHGRGAMEGRVSQMLYNSNLFDRRDTVVVLSGAGMHPLVETSVAANAWIKLDDACALHYEIVTSGLNHNEDETLRAQLVVGMATDAEKKWDLRDFKGNVLRGLMANPSSRLLTQLSEGDATLLISSKLKPDGHLAAKVHISNTCHTRDTQPYSENEVLEDEEDFSRENDVINRNRCYEDGKVRDDGESWIPQDLGECHMCNCKMGKAECHKTICPKPQCDRPITIKGDCCPQCVETLKMETCYFEGDKRRHHFGTQWHPYVPPFGFSECAICSCSTGPSEINCTRLECPRLNCLEFEAVRRNPTDCCKVCPDRVPSTAVDDVMQGDGNIKGSCTLRGIKYPNGSEWKPRIQPFGQMDCITCSCVDGDTKCRRQKCPKINCRRKVKKGTSCCPVCAEPRTGGRRRARQRGNDR